MPQNIQTFNLLDFTGGLNLEPDQFKLAVNESPDALNVDVSVRGGITHRLGYQAWQDGVSAGSSPIKDAHPWYGNEVTGPCVLVCHQDGSIGELTASSTRSYQTVFAADPNISTYWSTQRQSAEFGPNLFLSESFAHFGGSSGSHVVNAITGVTEFSAGMAAVDFNDDLDNPTEDQMPRAKAIATWQGSMWAANIYEGTTPVQETTRLRWSHPNYPMDWHSQHYVDIGADDGGAITALVPDGDRLLVFRERAIHAVVGAPPESISIYQVSETLGVRDWTKVARSPYGVFFWEDERGLYRIGQQSVEWQFERLYPALASGRLDGTNAAVSWGGDRLYVAADYLTEDLVYDYQSWFVFDPTAGKRGAWTRHAIADGTVTVPTPTMVWFDPPSASSEFLVLFGDQLVARSSTVHQDSFAALGASTITNQARFKTAWVDLGEPGQKKRFRRADVFGSGLDENQQLDLGVFADYDSVNRRRSSELSLHQSSTGGVWGTDLWGSFEWGLAGQQTPVVDRTAPLGRQRAVQLQFTDTTTPASLPWTVDSVVVKFTPLRVRG